MRPKRGPLMDSQQATALVEKLIFTEKMSPAAFTELCAAASMGGGKDLLIDAGAIVVIVAALQQFHAHRRLQRTALDALTVLMEAEGGCAHAVVAGCVEEILHVMQVHQVDPKIQAQCCHILSQIFSDARLVRIAPSLHWSAVPALAQAMRQHREDVAVQLEACQALTALLGAMPLYRQVIVHGGIESVIAAMLRFSHSAQLLNCACITLSVLLRDPAATQRIVELGGVEVVLESLRLHKCEASVQEAGCYALWPLSLTDCGKAAILAAQGARALVQAMLGHPTEVGIQQCCAATLAQLSRSKAGRRQAVAAGGREAVLQAVKLHSNDPKMLLFGGRALEKMQRGLQLPQFLHALTCAPRRCPHGKAPKSPKSALWSTVRSLWCLKPP
eukprot:EG_transcript_5494